jgi:radical SAM superfamily enzyme YgiQ (UPF0313 family)
MSIEMLGVRVHIVNPSHFSFGKAFITPRWMFVLAASTPVKWGDPILSDESLEPFDTDRLEKGDVVGIGLHTGNALVGYALGQRARARGAWVVYGGSHPTLFPEEALERGGAHAVVKGDGDVVWGQVIEDCVSGAPQQIYNGGRIDAGKFRKARWDLMKRESYAWASVQTVRGCPKHCSFCSVWRTDGQEPRQRDVHPVIEEIVELRRLGFRFIALADDNFYPVTLEDLRIASRRADKARYNELKMLREERFELMALMALLPSDLNFFTQITMEAAEDPEFLDAMRAARIRGALVGIEAVTPEGLKDVYKDFNLAGEDLVERLQTFRKHGIYILGSFIFGLPSDRPATFEATASLAKRADLTFAQFAPLTPFPGTLDFEKWERKQGENMAMVDGIPVSRHWLIPQGRRPKVLTPHPVMSGEQIRQGTQNVWNDFYSLKASWKRSDILKSYKNRVAFVIASKVMLQAFGNTGLSIDSARVSSATKWGGIGFSLLQKMFTAPPLPDLMVPRTSMTGEKPAA